MKIHVCRGFAFTKIKKGQTCLKYNITRGVHSQFRIQVQIIYSERPSDIIEDVLKLSDTRTVLQNKIFIYFLLAVKMSTRYVKSHCVYYLYLETIS